MIYTKNQIKIHQLKSYEIQIEIFDLVSEFIHRSRESERNVDSIIIQACNVVERGGACWLIRDGLDPVGYFFAEIMPTEYGTTICFIHELFISPRHSRKRLINSIDEIIGSWARTKNTTEIAFFTRRDPWAFRNLLKNGWDIDSFVMKRCV